MFAPFGLFAQIPCPDQGCKRSPCLFSHNPNLKDEVIEGDALPPKNRARLVGRPIGSVFSISKPSTISIPSSAPRAPIVPILQAIPRLSRQPVHDRRKGLEKLYQEYLKAYVKLSPTNPGLAAEHALTEEKSISVGTTTASYGPAIHSACVTIRQRPVPKSLTSPYVGINKEVKVKVQKWEEDKQSEPTRERAGRYMLTLDQMRTFGYVLGLPEVEGGTHPDAAGERKMCDRCGAEFVVKGKAEEGSEHQGSTGACVYHWGRATMERVDGHRMARWSCCGSDRSMNEPGCAFAEFHVFKDGKSWRFSERPSVADIEAREAAEEEEVEILHSREPFKSTKKVLREVYAALGDPGKKRKRSGVHEVLAMDCEMIYTTGGMSLARVSVLDAKGESLLDEFVKQKSSILDVNEKFSGLTMNEMLSATKNLAAVRQAVCALMDEDTIMIGHGLENDLKSLRLIHRKVIDTAVLFPHPKGPPFRRALKDLTSEKLGVFIQNNILEEGHDSGADARAALDLVKWKIKKDNAAPGDFSYT